MNNFNYDLIRLQLYQLENDFNAKMDKLKKEISVKEEKKIPEKLKLSSHWNGTFEEEQKDKEIERLNNIINELVLECYNSSLGLGEFSRIWRIAFNEDYEPNKIDKLKELKGEDK